MRVFLSYHTPDRALALGLKSAIEAALPGADVFVDQTHLRYGHLWQPALFDAITKAQAFVVLVSNRLGDWQKVEYYEARDRKAKDDGFVLLPVIIADRAKGPAANLPGLAQLHWIESTEPAAPEPLAKIVAPLQSREIPKPPEPWRAINPYRGLLALEEQDADFFFGRDRETGDILDRLIAASGRFIALVGNSGVGKSSSQQAGVIGALKRQRWPGGQHAWPDTLKDSRAWAYLTMKPGEDPMAALASEFAALWFADATDPQRVTRRNEWTKLLREGHAGLADLIETTDKRFRDELALTPPPRIFLYIDQGEELYARSSPAERKRFSEIIADGLASSPKRLIVMTSQRADYYGDLQANAALFDLTEKIDVPPLKANNLGLVLREPARVLGVGFESDDLVSHIVKSAEYQPGALPLLADLFTDLWERMRERGDGVLRVSDRREIIQVGAALTKRADQFLAQHPDKHEAVKRLFTLRLAHVPRQGEPVRARWERDAEPSKDTAADAEWALVELLAGPDWRLLVTGEKDGKAVAEVAHEILLKTWPTLKSWLEDEREFLIWRGEIAARREDWEKAGKIGAREQRQALLMGYALDTAEKRLAERRGDLQPSVVDFIEASGRESRKAARTWAWMQRAVGLLMVVIIAGLVAYINQAFLQEEYYRQVTMGLRVLTAAEEKEKAAKPGPETTFKECSNGCPTMVVVPAGTFKMGSSWGGGANDERPQHDVTIPRAFAVGRTEVTYAEWDVCVQAGACPKISDNAWGRGDRPAILMSWEEAKGYVDWLKRMSGKDYRLLSSAEWEYAARAGTTTLWSFGDAEQQLGDYAWYSSNASGKTQPVAGKKPNAFGLYDMHGNVREWVADHYHGNYRGAPTDGTAWTEGGDASSRVVRGGSWVNFPEDLRSANRGGYSSDGRDSVLGFRVGRTLTP